jgi:hypothetical protein
MSAKANSSSKKERERENNSIAPSGGSWLETDRLTDRLLAKTHSPPPFPLSISLSPFRMQQTVESPRKMANSRDVAAAAASAAPVSSS